MRQNIRLIAADLDGTLLRTDKTISDRTVAALERCRAQGILTAFATARSETASARFSARFAPDVFISNGGALARRGGTVLYRAVIPCALANGIFRDCLASPAIAQITCETDKGYFNSLPLDTGWPGWMDYANSVHWDFIHALDCDAYKIVLRTGEENAAANIAQKHPSIRVQHFTGESWYVICHREATKWNAIRHVAARLGIPIAEIAAFGDDYNDIEMLRNCGIGVAMANAQPEAMAAADCVCASNDEDGLALWIAGRLHF